MVGGWGLGVGLGRGGRERGGGRRRGFSSGEEFLFDFFEAAEHAEEAEGVGEGIDLGFFGAVDGLDGDGADLDALEGEAQEDFGFGGKAAGGGIGEALGEGGPVIKAIAALGVGDVLAHVAGEQAGHGAVDEPAQGGHSGEIAHARADEDGAVGPGVGLQKRGDVGGGMLAVGIEGDHKVEAVFAGIVEAGLERGTLALVVDMLQDGGAGFRGGAVGVVGGAIVDHDDFRFGAEVANFADDGADAGFLLEGGNQNADVRRGGGHGKISGGQ